MTRVELYRDLAFSLAKRSTCKRANVGAVLVKGNRIIGTGYNGSPKGCNHCLDMGCFTSSNGQCRGTIHAEVNAILSAAQSGIEHGPGTLCLYSTLRPCLECIKVAIAVGVERIYYFEHREDPEAISYEWYLRNNKVPFEVIYVIDVRES